MVIHDSKELGVVGALTQVFPLPPTTISGRFPAPQRARAPPPHFPLHLDAILGHFWAKVDQSGSFWLALHPKLSGATRALVARVHWHSHKRRKETPKGADLHASTTMRTTTSSTLLLLLAL